MQVDFAPPSDNSITISMHDILTVDVRDLSLPEKRLSVILSQDEASLDQILRPASKLILLEILS